MQREENENMDDLGQKPPSCPGSGFWKGLVARAKPPVGMTPAMALDRLRLWLTFYLALAIIVAIVILLFRFTDQSSAIAGIGVIGTVVGSVTGHAQGAMGKERADERIDERMKAGPSK